MAKAKRSTASPGFTLTRSEKEKCKLWLNGLNAALNSFVKENSALTRLLLSRTNDSGEQVAALNLLVQGKLGEFETWYRARNG